MTDFDSFQYGGVTYPLTSATTNSLLQDADPSLYYVIDFFKSVLTTHMGTRLLAQVATAPAITTITAAVATVCPYNPDPYLTENQVQFPLLCVYRNKADYNDVTTTWIHETGEWTVQYILPPLNPGQIERIGPILAAVPKIINNRIENTSDPAYASGASFLTLAGLEAIRLVSGTWGRYEVAGNLVFPCWTGKLEVKERVMPTTFGALTGFDNEEDLYDAGTNTTVLDVVDTETTFP